jgi:N-acetylmuramoyl-L-alanine amidase
MPHLPPKLAVNQVRLLIGLLAFLIATGLQAAEPKDSHHVKAVRFWTLGDVTRIAVETDGTFQVRSDRLENPERLFFDLVGTQPSLGDKNLTVIPVSDHLVRQIRVAETQRNVTRIVLDMEGPAVATTSRLDNPNRLIIELRAPSQAVAAKPVVETPVEIVPVVALKEAAPKEIVPPKTIERREFTPPPPAHAESTRPVPVALLEPPRVAARPSNSAISSNFASKLSPAITTSSLAAPPPAPIVSALPSTTLNSATSPLPAPTAVPVSAPETALPAKRNSVGGRSMIRVLGLKVGRIVLDPGHGGHDTGTIGPEGLREKDLVLDVAKRLGALIEERLGSEVIYTRNDDVFVPLERRTEIANEAKADLFLSIHANSSTLHSVAGVETYYLNFTTSKAALEVAARENSGSQKTVYELQDLLEKIALKDKVEESREFATRIQSALFSASAKGDPRARDRGIRKAPFVVLIGATMPSVLSEIGFISNAHDESIMKRSEYRERLAEALYKGLAGYANTLSHFQVAQRH